LNQHLDVVKLLVEYGANIDHQVREISNGFAIANWLTQSDSSCIEMYSDVGAIMVLVGLFIPSMLAFCRHPVAAPLC